MSKKAKPKITEEPVESQSDMEEIAILPSTNPSSIGQMAFSPEGIEYRMSIRDYQNLSGPPLRFNRKATNRIMGKRNKSPSEKDHDSKRKRALEDIFDIISNQEQVGPSSTSSATGGTCQYKGQVISYKKRRNG